MSARTTRWIIAAAIAALIFGAILSRVIEPGVRVEKIMLTANTPALRLSPATPGPHPIALLAHGATGSKENLFRFGEALAAAGFDCYSVDQAGHGESPQPCAFWHVDGKWRWATNILLKPRELERALGSVDVFIGHSMGGGAGEWGVIVDGFRPKLFIGVGFPVELGEHGPPVLLLAGDRVRRCASGLDRYGHTRHAPGFYVVAGRTGRWAARSRSDTATAGGV